jgi:hypothetical protein
MLEPKMISICYQYRLSPGCTTVLSEKALYCLQLTLSNSILKSPKTFNGLFQIQNPNSKLGKANPLQRFSRLSVNLKGSDDLVVKVSAS